MVRIRIGSTSDDDGSPAGVLGRLFATLFFGAFLAAGLFFCGMIAKEVGDIAGTYGWAETPCRIDHASVSTGGDSDAPYGLRVAYAYEVDGREHRSDRFSSQPRTDDDYEPLARYADALITEPSPVCYVNPDDPGDAILRRTAPWMALFILIPLAFVFVGGGGIYFIWFGKTAKAKRAAPKLGAAKSEGCGWIGALILVVVAIAGLITGWYLMVRPIAMYVDSAGWIERPCTIESSTVRSHSSDDGTTYSVDVLYRYELNGHTYRSNRHDIFAFGSSSGYDGKKAFAARYPRGSKHRCLVNPDDPYEAVLERRLSLWALIALLPIVLLGIGFGGLYAMARSASRERGRTKRAVGERRDDAPDDADEPDWLPTSPYDAGPVQLKPTLGRLGKLAGIVFFALFWNGIVSVFLVHVVKSHMKGDPEWFLTLFMVPFVLVGIGLIGAVIHQLLALFNPRVVVNVSSAVVTPGEQLEISWDLVGPARRVRRLRITIEGREEATYTRGTDTVTDKHTFAEIPVTDTDDPHTIDTGRSLLTLPRKAVHSFEASNNKIKWMITVHGEIKRWPDISSEYALIVRPIDPHAPPTGADR